MERPLLEWLMKYGLDSIKQDECWVMEKKMWSIPQSKEKNESGSKKAIVDLWMIARMPKEK